MTMKRGINLKLRKNLFRPLARRSGRIIEIDDSSVRIADVPVFLDASAEVVAELVQRANADRQPKLLVTPNVDQVINLSAQPEFRAAYAKADRAVLDGMPLVWLARAAGNRQAKRNTGADLLNRVCEIATSRTMRVVIAGGHPGAAKAAAENLFRTTGAEVVSVEIPMLEGVEDARSLDVIAAIRESDPDVVFLCLGSPKQELWFVKWKDQLPPAVYIGAGASADFAAGRIRRAPLALQKSGFEWLWRLAEEPGRLWRRYLVKGPTFVVIALPVLAARAKQLASEVTPVRALSSTDLSRQLTVAQLGPEPGYSGGIAAVIGEFSALQTEKYVHRVIPTWRPNSSVKSMWMTTVAALNLAKSRQTWHVAHAHLSEKGSFVREGALVFVCAGLLRRPVVVTLHGAEFESFAERHPRLVGSVLRRASHIMCLGQRHQSLVEAIAPATNSSTIMNPLGAEWLSQPVLFRDLDAELSISFIGELSHRKGFDRLIAAWPNVSSQFGKCRLVIAGPSKDFDASEIRESDAAPVEYRGVLDRAALKQVYAESHILVLPSRAEVLPMTILEALSAGVRVVYAKVGEWQEFVGVPGVTLVDVEGLSEEKVVQNFEGAVMAAVSDMASRSSKALSMEITAWLDRNVSPVAIGAQLDATYDALVSMGGPNTVRGVDE